MYTKDIILSYVSPNLAHKLEKADTTFFEKMTELRIRVDKPLLIYQLGKEYGVGEKGFEKPESAYRPTASDIAETIERISQYSLYALEEELRMGYITLPGGHRVGIVGKGVIEKGSLRTIRPISGLNIRISRAIKGCSSNIFPQILDTDTQKRLPHNTLIISPPGCGKTTLLRDIIRKLSDELGLTIGVVDERSEIGGSYKGIAQNDVGIRTDLLDGCPKAEGMVLLLRAMAPDVIAVDELGGSGDAIAVENVSNAGVRLISTVHGYGIEDIRQKPNLKVLFDKGIFKKFVVLRKPGEEGTVFSQ
ncbi:MAG: stage III sporulation protein AA [Defluviitaleaceae bacterium]|nr:stage III sporulation protein AA [Defluviitaleaceae bacterium]